MFDDDGFFKVEPVYEQVLKTIEDNKKDVMELRSILFCVPRWRKPRVEIVDKLLSHGMSIKVKGEYRELHECEILDLAASQGHLELVEYLLEKGADINKDDIMSCAASSGNLKLVLFLLGKGLSAKGKKGVPIIAASKIGHIPMIELLLQHGVEVDQENKDGSTALITACEQDHIEVVKFLLSAGAFVNHVDNCGKGVFRALNYYDSFRPNGKQIDELLKKAKKEQEELIKNYKEQEEKKKSKTVDQKNLNILSENLVGNSLNEIQFQSSSKTSPTLNIRKELGKIRVSSSKKNKLIKKDLFESEEESDSEEM